MNPNLPVGGSALNFDSMAGAALPEDLTSIQLATTFSHFGSGRTGDGSAVTAVPTLNAFRTSIGMRHFFGEGWSAGMTLPTGWVHVQTPDGAVSEVAGIGDIQLRGSYDLSGIWGPGPKRPSLVVQAGVGLPTGEQNRATTSIDASPNILSIGSGSFSPNVGVAMTQMVSNRLGLSLRGSARLPFHANNIGIRMGGMLNGNVDMFYLPCSKWIFQLGVNAQAVGRATENTNGTLVNSGGTWLRAAPRALFRPHKRIGLSLGVQIPFYIHANGTQAVETISGNFGISIKFGGKKEHKHDHGDAHDDHGDAHDDHGDAHDDHGDAHDDHGDGHDDHGDDDDHGASGHDDHGTSPPPKLPSGGDVADIATGGASFDKSKASVVGKITVIDFWAEWCAPCKKLDVMLRQLAADRPDIAVRRAEVIDFDHDIADDHLGGVTGLPLLWIYDASGKHIDTITSKTPSVVRARILKHVAH